MNEKVALKKKTRGTGRVNSTYQEVALLSDYLSISVLSKKTKQKTNTVNAMSTYLTLTL